MKQPMEIIYQDRRVLGAIKPPGVLSTNEPGGMPALLREALGEPEGCVRPVHRLDRVVGGVMVFARSAAADRELSRQIREHQFRKQYLAVVRGAPEEAGVLKDLLFRDRAARRTLVAEAPGKGVQQAELRYEVLERRGENALLAVTLETGRTHQIRVQMAHHGMPIWGDQKYGTGPEGAEIALWSCHVGFRHPESGRELELFRVPPETEPWRDFTCLGRDQEILDVVDGLGEPTGTRVPRTLAHRLGIRHRTAHVWLLRRGPAGPEVLLQKRSPEKDSYPGCYDISSAGHIPAGVDFVPSALRELREELGVTARGEELILCGQRAFEFQAVFHGTPFHDRQISNVYALWLDRAPEAFDLQASEVSEVRWMPFDECLRRVRENSMPHCIYPEELEMLKQAL